MNSFYTYYKIDKTSETGRKFTALLARAKECETAAAEFAKKCGFHGYTLDGSTFAGRPFTLFNPVITKSRRPGWMQLRGIFKGEYQPNIKHSSGRSILREMSALPFVSVRDVNDVVNVATDYLNFAMVGFRGDQNDTYYGLMVLTAWEVTLPPDCIEISDVEYLENFGSNEYKRQFRVEL